MSATHGTRPKFTVREESPTDSDVLLAGFSEVGLGGLTAVDYLVDQLDLDVCGHVSVTDLPTITPFENGTPRHPIRLFSREDLNVTVLVTEPIVPVFASRTFAETLLSWTDDAGVDEIVVLSGVPVNHAPEDHRTFYVATPDYQAHRLADAEVPGMGNGFLDGVSGSLLAAGIDSPLRVGVFVTPAHVQSPDVEAAIRLVETVDTVYGLGVDTAPLQEFAEAVETHYQELAQRIEQADDDILPEDRMYM